MARRVMSKPGVGKIVFVSRWWRPSVVTHVLFRPVGTRGEHPMDVSGLEALAASETVEQAMAVVRSHPVERH